MNKIITLILSLLISDIAFGQYAFFANRGKISFDKVTYTKARMRSMQQQMGQNNPGGFGGRMFDLDNLPESTTEKYILEFDENATLMYSNPNAQSTDNQPRGQNLQMQGGQIRTGRGGVGQGRGAAQNMQGQGRDQGAPRVRPNNSQKILAQNLKNLTSEVQIQIDEKYIITDSLNQVTWRFTEEYRNIAGYECRRVNGATKDSLYIIAFYTDELPISGGPALSNGLPGMILGLIIPEMHIQYWATKVDYTNDLVQKNWKDKKAQALHLDDFIKSFGRFFQRGRDTNSSKRQVQEQLIY